MLRFSGSRPCPVHAPDAGRGGTLLPPPNPDAPSAAPGLPVPVRRGHKAQEAGGIAAEAQNAYRFATIVTAIEPDPATTDRTA